MRKSNFKRAIVECIKVSKPKSEYDVVHRMKQYQDVIKVTDRVTNAEMFNAYRKEISRLRKIMSAPRPQVYTFKVTIPQYRFTGEINHTYEAKTDTYKAMIKEVIDEGIRQARRKLVTEPVPVKFAGKVVSFTNVKKPRVFAKEGEVLRLHVEKNINALYNDKKPELPRKYVGIELEFCAPIKKNEFAVKLFKAGIHKFAQLKTDGSLRPHDGEEPFELAILLEETNYKKGLRKITDLLKSVKAVVEDRRCGLHVHLDMRRRNKDVVYNNLVACQYALLSVVDPGRYNNEFCRVVKTRKFPTEFTGERQERYKTINAAAYYKYKTLEVRMHEGCVDYDQISNWVGLLIKVANYPKKIKTSVSKVPALNRRFKLNPNVYKYAIDRSCYWQIQNTEMARNIREDRDAGLAPLRPRNQNRTTNNVQEQLNVLRGLLTDDAGPQPTARGGGGQTERPTFTTNPFRGPIDPMWGIQATTPADGGAVAQAVDPRAVTLTTTAAAYALTDEQVFDTFLDEET